MHAVADICSLQLFCKFAELFDVYLQLYVYSNNDFELMRHE
jgi:hypothetical protein